MPLTTYGSINFLLDDISTSSSQSAQIKQEPEEEEFEEDFDNPLNATVFSGSKKANYDSKINLTEKRFESADIFLQYLDKIDPTLIAGLDTALLFKHAPTFAKPMLAMTMEPLSNNEADVFMDPKGLPFRENPKTFKGYPREVVEPILSEAIAKLMLQQQSDPSGSGVSLFSKDHSLEREWIKNNNDFNKACFRANIFPVDKTTFPDFGDKSIPLQRTIVDSRMANQFLENTAPMELFTIEILERIVASNFAQDKTVYTISADLRQMFHQLPLPRRFRKHYAINLGSAGLLFPNVWPMGAAPAAGIGQSSTWSLLLSGLEQDLQKRISLGIQWIGSFDKLFQWLPLKGGGAILVLIDNIFIITTDKKIFEAWEKRIPEVAEKFHATLKEQKINPSKRSNKIQVVIFPVNNTTTEVEFSGILFSRIGMRPKEVVDVDPQLDKDEVLSWKGTFRQLAGVIGQCLWTKRVQSHKMINMPEFTNICRFIYPTTSQTWDDLIHFHLHDAEPTTFAQVLRQLKSLYRSCRGVVNEEGIRDFPITPYKKFRSMTQFVRLATDASYNNNTATLGWVWSFYNSDTFRIRTHKRSGKSQIAIEELRAVVMAIEEIILVAIDEGREIDTFLIAIDSNHAKGMIVKGTAKTEEARQLLLQLDAILAGRNIIFTFVKSALNPADAPSRELEFDCSLMSELLRVFEMMKYAAMFDGAGVRNQIVEHDAHRREREEN